MLAPVRSLCGHPIPAPSHPTLRKPKLLRYRLVGSIVALLFCAFLNCQKALASCASPANAIERENCLPGSPESEWDISGAGAPSIQGFATDISVNVGQTIFFKIN